MHSEAQEENYKGGKGTAEARSWACILIPQLLRCISDFTFQPCLCFQLMPYFFLTVFLRRREKFQWAIEQARVCAWVYQTNKIISCIRKYDKSNLWMLDQREAKPWVSDAAVNEWKTIPSHSMFCARLDEAVIQRQEVVQPLPHYTNTLRRQRLTKGWGQGGYSSPRLPNKSASAQHFT